MMRTYYGAMMSKKRGTDEDAHKAICQTQLCAYIIEIAIEQRERWHPGRCSH